MALFGSPLDKARTMVRDAIRGLGGDPEKAGIPGTTDTWLVRKGSAGVVVRLLPEDAKGRSAFLQFTSPVMKVPPDAGFYEKLARLNFEMGGLATFSVTPANEVHLTAARTIDGLTPPEIAHALAQVAYYSDLYDDQLLNAYGRQYAMHTGQKR
jgi:hypothetical protein